MEGEHGIKKGKVEQPELFMYYCFADKKHIKERGCSMYIITEADTLENIKDYEIKIEAPKDMRAFFRGSREQARKPISDRI